jgi:dihydrofolate reductase
VVRNFSISIDGFGAARSQSLDNPIGVGGGRLHEWIFATRSGRAMIGAEGGSEGLDDDYFANRDANVGATIMGRNMFGPVRGPWGQEEWTGWWGENPPFHHPVFVLTHHARPPLVMDGGTTFHFVDGGIDVALERANAAAEGADVLIGGGASTIRQYLAAGLLDEFQLTIVPVLLGGGERLFDELDFSAAKYECAEHVSSPAVTHVRFVKAHQS